MQRTVGRREPQSERGVMRIWSLLILALCLICLVPLNVSASDAYLSTPMKLWVDVPGGYGEASFKIFINNASSVDRTFAMSHWYNYMNPAEGYQGIPESWITDFTPNNIVLHSGGEAIINVTVDIPQGTPSGKYLTWLKIRDDPVSEERPIVVIIRTGEAVPTYEYSMEPGFYQLNAVVWANGEPPESDSLKLVVKNTGMGDCAYRLYVPNRFKVNGEQWRDGNTYRPIYELECADTIEEMDEIVVVPDSVIDGSTIIGDAINIQAYSKGELPFEINIPKGIPDGYYEARVGVQIAEGDLAGTTIGIQYECRLLIHVTHEKSVGTNWGRWWPLALVAGVLGFGLVGMVVLERRKRNA